MTINAFGFGLQEENVKRGTTLHYKLLSEGTFDTLDLVCHYLDPWLTQENVQRWKNEAIFNDEIAIIASDIDKFYAYIGSTWFKDQSKKWVLIEVPTSDLLNYGLKHWGFETPETKRDRDEAAVKRYSLKMKQTQPPPIVLGASATLSPELLDGMHRIYAAFNAGVKSLRVFVPGDGLRWFIKT